MIRFALAQINPTVGDLKGNVQKIIANINAARQSGVDMVIFPELAICGYPPEDLVNRKHFIKDNLKALQIVIKAASKIACVVGFVDLEKNNNIYNAAAVISDGKLKGVYHKKHLPNYGVFDERRYFTSGNNRQIFSVNGVPIGINICEDIWVDHDVYVQQQKTGAKVFINISASPYNIGKLSQREKVVQGRAKDHNAFVLYTNLVGGQDELVFDGGSMAADPKGRIIASANQFAEDLLIVDIDVHPAKRKPSSQVIELKKISKVESLPPPVKMTRAKQYLSLERIYHALVLGTRDYIQKNRFKKVLIGLSGGIDSAMVATIAVEAIGKDNVIGVTMPSRYSSEGTKSDAHLVAKNLGIPCWEIPIEGVFKVMLETLQPQFAGHAANIAEENLQARIRGNLLMALSNKFGWLVLTTGNKSEFATGYCTLYGDMSGGFAPLKDVPKTKVYELARFVNQSGEVIPQTTIDRAPTAELRENQKDQDSLPPYDVLDRILEQTIEKEESFEKVSRGTDSEIVKKVLNLIDQSEYKRRQSPPGVKITTRAFGKDWRLPITNRYKPF